MARRPPIKTQTTKPKPPKPKRDHLDQQGVVALRNEDQIVVVQNGQQKLLLIGSLVDALKAMSLDTYSTMAVGAHTHPESDVINLGTDLNTLVAAIAGKAALSHVHEIGDIHSNYVDATAFPPTVYNGAYPVVVKTTVSGGNAVFQFTANGLAAGAAIFPNGPLPNGEQFRAEEGANPHAFGAAVWSNSNKTLTVPVSKTGAALVVLGLSVLGANVAANGSVVYAIVWGH